MISWPRPPNASPRTEATVARPIVVTRREADAGDDQRDGERQLDPDEPLAAGVAHPLGRLEDVGRDAR